MKLNIDNLAWCDILVAEHFSLYGRCLQSIIVYRIRIMGCWIIISHKEIKKIHDWIMDINIVCEIIIFCVVLCHDQLAKTKCCTTEK